MLNFTLKKHSKDEKVLEIIPRPVFTLTNTGLREFRVHCSGDWLVNAKVAWTVNLGKKP